MIRKALSILGVLAISFSLLTIQVKAQQSDFSWYPAELKLMDGAPGQKESTEIEFKNNIDTDVVFTTVTIVETVNGKDNVVARTIDNNIATNNKLDVVINDFKDNKLVIAKKSSVKVKFDLTFPETLKEGTYAYKILLSEDPNNQVLSGDVQIDINAGIKSNIVFESSGSSSLKINPDQLKVAGIVIAAICILLLAVFIVIVLRKKKK